MADDRRYELEDLTIRPGTYFNPQTEVLVVVDDSPSMDNEIFNLEEFEGADWVLISDDVPVDEDARDTLLEGFQATYHGGDGRHVGEEVARRRTTSPSRSSSPIPIRTTPRASRSRA